MKGVLVTDKTGLKMFVFINAMIFAKLSDKGKRSIEKNVFFRACPNKGGGVYPCPSFLALFLEVHFWSIKRVYFFKNANVLNF